MTMIWSTRGLIWGFTFLRTGDVASPLALYREAFEGTETEFEFAVRRGSVLALRFPDPEGREDDAGRVIVHDFVVFEPLASRIHTVSDGIRLIWESPGVHDLFAEWWDRPSPPTNTHG